MIGHLWLGARIAGFGKEAQWIKHTGYVRSHDFNATFKSQVSESAHVLGDTRRAHIGTPAKGSVTAGFGDARTLPLFGLYSMARLARVNFETQGCAWSKLPVLVENPRPLHEAGIAPGFRVPQAFHDNLLHRLRRIALRILIDTKRCGVRYRAA